MTETKNISQKKEDQPQRHSYGLLLCLLVFVALLAVLVGAALHLRGMRKHAEYFWEAVRKSKGKEREISSLTDFSWEKGYCFPPYTSRTTMEKALGFSSPRLRDNIVNDDVWYLVFVRNQKVACAFYSKEAGVDLELPETFTPESIITLSEEKTGQFLLSYEKERDSKEDGKGGADKKGSGEDSIYTFLQGPKSWTEQLTWSGEWGTLMFDGRYFGGFGCGLCCMANLYSSLTPYCCTPVHAYRYAKKETGYAGGRAIDWGHMRHVLTLVGFTCSLENKPDTYRQFQKEIAACQGAVVLVSSKNSKCYWKNTSGHYVTVFLYDKAKDRIFLADSGNPDHNRKWVPLQKIYKSLKTESSWQYLLVKDYKQEEDAWKHKKANGNWIRQD